jgi:hypothetical protein
MGSHKAKEHQHRERVPAESYSTTPHTDYDSGNASYDVEAQPYPSDSSYPPTHEGSYAEYSSGSSELYNQRSLQVNDTPGNAVNADTYDDQPLPQRYLSSYEDISAALPNTYEQNSSASSSRSHSYASYPAYPASASSTPLTDYSTWPSASSSRTHSYTYYSSATSFGSSTASTGYTTGTKSVPSQIGFSSYDNAVPVSNHYTFRYTGYSTIPFTNHETVPATCYGKGTDGYPTPQTSGYPPSPPPPPPEEHEAVSRGAGVPQGPQGLGSQDPGHAAPQRKYNQVKVLLLNWEDDDNLPGLTNEVKALERMFRKKFSYTTRIFPIPTRDSESKLKAEVDSFFDQSREGELRILYYGGHGVYDRDNPSVPFNIYR